MANIKSSKKAIKVIAKKTDNNHEAKAKVKNLIKDIEKLIAAEDKEGASKLYKDFQKACDNALSKGLIKANTADRQKSNIQNLVNSLKK